MKETIMTIYNKAENLNSQSIASIHNPDKNQFIFCTNSINKQNQIHFIEYNEESQRIIKNQIYAHSGILDTIHPLVNNPNQAFLSVKQNKQYQFKLLDFNQFQNQQFNVIMEKDWDSQILSVNQIAESKILITDENELSLFDYENQEIIQKINLENIQKSKKDPHHENIVCSIQENNILITDLRDQSKNQSIQNMHNQQILDMDFNPNKQHFLMTSGQDYSIKFWDLRKNSIPVKIIQDINNWPLQCQYNNFHDQLIISAYDDGSINLHKILSVSSATMVQNEAEPDELIKNYDDFDDSVSSLVWSSTSAWVFASISYSGNVIIYQVPTNEKFKILL